jgi:hypothetical protein
MSGKSNYLEDKLLNWALKGAAMGTAPVAVYVALFNGDPTDTGAGGTEVTTTIRVAGRVAVTFGSITTASGANSVSNSADVDFGAAAAGATMTHFAIFDAASAGNMLYSAPLTGGTQSVSTGTAVKFTTGSLTVSED